MKKTVIFLIALFSVGCYFWYYQADQAQKAEELLWAAYDGDLTAVKNALEDGAPLNYLFHISDPARHYENAQLTPLLAAASGGNTKVLLYLLKQGQDFAQANKQGWTPLFIAVRDGHAEAAAQLVHAGADPNVQTDTGTTPLLLALLADFPTEKERLALMQYLLKRGADPNLSTVFGTDALFYAITERQDPAAAELLLKHGADPCRTYQGKTLAEWLKNGSSNAALSDILKTAARSCTGK